MFIKSLALFILEIHRDKNDFLELEKRNDENILKDIEQFLKSKSEKTVI